MILSRGAQSRRSQEGIIALLIASLPIYLSQFASVQQWSHWIDTYARNYTTAYLSDFITLYKLYRYIMRLKLKQLDRSKVVRVNPLIFFGTTTKGSIAFKSSTEMENTRAPNKMGGKYNHENLNALVSYIQEVSTLYRLGSSAC